MLKIFFVVLMLSVSAQAQDATTIDIPDSTYRLGIQSSPVTHLALDRTEIQYGHESYTGGYAPLREVVMTIQNLAFVDGVFYPSPNLPPILTNPRIKLSGVILGPKSTIGDSLQQARFDSLMTLPTFRQMFELQMYAMRDNGLIAANHPFFSLPSAFSDSTDIPFLGGQ